MNRFRRFSIRPPVESSSAARRSGVVYQRDGACYSSRDLHLRSILRGLAFARSARPTAQIISRVARLGHTATRLWIQSATACRHLVFQRAKHKAADAMKLAVNKAQSYGAWHRTLFSLIARGFSAQIDGCPSSGRSVPPASSIAVITPTLIDRFIAHSISPLRAEKLAALQYR